MSDLISRQSAISIVTFECGKWTGLSKEINKQIQNLPSAEPEPSRDVVDRATMLETYADLYDMFDSYPNICNDIHVVYDKLRNLPSAQPEIIRCKDCKYYCNVLYSGTQFECGKCCRTFIEDVKPDDFCSRTERRTNA